MKKLLLLLVFVSGMALAQTPEFKWHVSDVSGKWGYLNVQWKDNCDSAVVALFDKDGDFVTKETVFLDFGVGKTLVTADQARRAMTAKIKCR